MASSVGPRFAFVAKFGGFWHMSGPRFSGEGRGAAGGSRGGADGPTSEKRISELEDDDSERAFDLDVGHPLDVPIDPPQRAIPDLVRLCIRATAVPRNVIDLERPSTAWIGDVEVHLPSVVQNDRHAGARAP